MAEVDLLETSSDDLQYLDNVLEDAGTAKNTRAALLKKAAVGAVGLGVLGPASAALAAAGRSEADNVKSLVTTAVTAEALAVTVLTAAVKAIPGTPPEKFRAVLKAANTTEFRHFEVLSSLGAKPLTTRFWIPNAALGDKNVNLFKTIEAAETIFVNAYLLGITIFAKAKQDKLARYAGEILGTEAEHRVLARAAQGDLYGSKQVPNDRAFELYTLKTTSAHVAALEKAGFGFGKQGATPGQFADFPGDPRKNGTGSSLFVPSPA